MNPTKTQLTEEEIYYRLRLVSDTCRFVGRVALSQMLDDVTVSLRDRYFAQHGKSIDSSFLADSDDPPEESL